MVTEIKAGDFSNREELEKHLASLTNLTTDAKTDVSIVGTEKELKELYLSHGKKCWGVAVIASDTVVKLKQKALRIDRGKIYKPNQPKSIDIKKSKEI